MFNQFKLYLYGIVGFVITGLYAMLKWKTAKLEKANSKILEAKQVIKAKTFEGKVKDAKSETEKPTDYKIEPGKYQLALVPFLFMFIGCSDKVTPVCPKLETVRVVKPIKFEVREGNCVCGDDLYNIFGGALELRKSESFYLDEVTSYNEEFTK